MYVEGSKEFVKEEPCIMNADKFECSIGSLLHESTVREEFLSISAATGSSSINFQDISV